MCYYWKTYSVVHLVLKAEKMFAFTGVLLRGNKQIRDEYISFHFSTKEKINRCGTVKNGSKSYYPHYEITFFSSWVLTCHLFCFISMLKWRITERNLTSFWWNNKGKFPRTSHFHKAEDLTQKKAILVISGFNLCYQLWESEILVSHCTTTRVKLNFRINSEHQSAHLSFGECELMLFNSDLLPPSRACFHFSNLRELVILLTLALDI